jgi:hypothetical protein
MPSAQHFRDLGAGNESVTHAESIRLQGNLATLKWSAIGVNRGDPYAIEVVGADRAHDGMTEVNGNTLRGELQGPGDPLPQKTRTGGEAGAESEPVLPTG